MYLKSMIDGICIGFRRIIHRVGLYTANVVSASSILFMLLFLLSPVLAAPASVRVIVVAVDHLSINDLQSAGPSIKAMTANSSIGLMNTGLYKDDALTFRYLAMASGTRPVSLKNIEPDFWNSDSLIGKSSAGDIFTFNTGRIASKGAIVCLNYQRLVREYGSESSFNSIDAGLIGEMLHQNGMKTAVIGKSSTLDENSSYAPLIAADSFGYIDSGDISHDVTRSDSENPCGIVDDIHKLISGVNGYASDYSLIVVQPGDLSRLEKNRPRLSDLAYQLGRKQAILQLDHLIGGLVPVADKYQASLMLVSSCRGKEVGGKYSNLAPVVVYRNGNFQSLLTSATTRTKGLISNIDIAPTILSAAGIPIPHSILGQLISSIPAIDTLEYLSRMDQYSADSFSIATPVFIILGIILILAITLCEFALRKHDIKKINLRKAFFLSIAIICVPASLLITDWIKAENLFQYIIRFIFSILFMMLITQLLARFISRSSIDFGRVHLAVILTATSLMYIVDILTSHRPCHWSIMNCDYISGIRYYGIGNEFMGLLLGTTLMAPLTLLMNTRYGKNDRRSFVSSRLALVIIVFWFTVATVVIGFPKLGANVGGLLTAIAVFSAALAVIARIPLNYRHGLIILAIAITAIIVFAVADMYNTSSVSHLG
ncbi:MAG: hypothetical protein ACYC0V_18885, partial [Armatimonadota bacterium]